MLQAILALDSVDVCLLQETLLRDPDVIRFPGYRVFSLPQAAGGRGLMTLVKDTFPAEM